MLMHCWHLQRAPACPTLLSELFLIPLLQRTCSPQPCSAIHAPLVVQRARKKSSDKVIGVPCEVQAIQLRVFNGCAIFPCNNLISSLYFALHVILHLVLNSYHVFLNWQTSCTVQALRLQSLLYHADSSHSIFACHIWIFPSARSLCVVIFPELLLVRPQVSCTQMPVSVTPSRTLSLSLSCRQQTTLTNYSSFSKTVCAHT